MFFGFSLVRLFYNFPVPSRRSFLSGLPAALLVGTAWPTLALAQEEIESDVQFDALIAGTEPFSFDSLTQAMRERAKESYQSPEIELGGFLADLDYDAYRHIGYWRDRAQWNEERSQFQIHAFHMGWLYNEPVQIYEVDEEGQVAHIDFSTADFEYRGPLAEQVPDNMVLPGVAGFRIHHPLNRADVFDELIAFLGASYFRALGRDNLYGISARGLAINTGLSNGEEFPRFSEFYLEKPSVGSSQVVVNAALESQSVTGAFRFVITPGRETEMDVTARLFFRADIEQIGIAPMTSMFLYAENNRSRFDDYRPQVHDSNGLRIERAAGETLWRGLNNPPRLASSYFAETNPRRFGLHQRDRDFADYQDAEAHYERRPSLDVVPLNEWGSGHVRLVEIPTDLEINDNIVAFWVPEDKARAGEEREYRYRLVWGELSPDENDNLAYVLETRTGHGGVSGVDNTPDLRKFVIDFKGKALGRLAPDADVEAIVSITRGEIVHQSLSKISQTDIWRLVVDVRLERDVTVELVAHLSGFGRRLSETWLYQWIATP